MTKALPPKSLVLYADDDPDDIDLVRESFEQYSQSISLIAFSDGIELLNYISRLKSFEPLPCLIILDVNMPVINGKQVLKEIRNMPNFEEVPVVLFSTSTLPSETQFAKSLGAGFVTKPLHTPQIYQLVDQLTEHCTENVKKNLRKLRGK